MNSYEVSCLFCTQFPTVQEIYNYDFFRCILFITNFLEYVKTFISFLIFLTFFFPPALLKMLWSVPPQWPILSLGAGTVMYVMSNEQVRDLCHKVLSSTQREGALFVSIQTLLLFNVAKSTCRLGSHMIIHWDRWSYHYMPWLCIVIYTYMPGTCI